MQRVCAYLELVLEHGRGVLVKLVLPVLRLELLYLLGGSFHLSRRVLAVWWLVGASGAIIRTNGSTYIRIPACAKRSYPAQHRRGQQRVNNQTEEFESRTIASLVVRRTGASFNLLKPAATTNGREKAVPKYRHQNRRGRIQQQQIIYAVYTRT